MRSIIIVLLTILFFIGTWGKEFDKKVPLNVDELYKNPLSFGFGDDIDWVPWENAIERALEINKPIFVLIHKTWCHACKALKKAMQQSNARKVFSRLSENFVMVNAADDEEPYEEEYRPDGKYIPRVLFLDKNGDLLSEFKNKKAEYKNYAYYYSSPADIINTMKDVLKYFGIDVPDSKKPEGLKPKKPPRKDAPEAPESKNKKIDSEKKVAKGKEEETIPDAENTKSKNSEL